MIAVKVFPGMGRGLVTYKNIRKGRAFLHAEIIPLSKQDTKLVEKTILGSYIYCLGRGKSAVALGFGSLFNHSQNENVGFEIVVRKGRTMIKYTALRNITAGEQLFLNYGYEP